MVNLQLLCWFYLLLCTDVYLWVRLSKHLWKDRRLLDCNFRRYSFEYFDAPLLSDHVNSPLHMVVVLMDMYFTFYDTNLYIGS